MHLNHASLNSWLVSQYKRLNAKGFLLLLDSLALKTSLHSPLELFFWIGSPFCTTFMPFLFLMSFQNDSMSFCTLVPTTLMCHRFVHLYLHSFAGMKAAINKHLKISGLKNKTRVSPFFVVRGVNSLDYEALSLKKTQRSALQ